MNPVVRFFIITLVLMLVVYVGGFYLMYWHLPPTWVKPVFVGLTVLVIITICWCVKMFSEDNP
jgi:hypothetical protein